MPRTTMQMLGLMLTCLWSVQAAAQRCQAQSAAEPPAVVELFTSEGCSSCPPADQWLSRIEPGGGVIALAFHVNYWNHLGWKDRFATPATTARQYAVKAASGAPYVYTPQVVLNGKDFRNWRGVAPDRLPRIVARAAPSLQLRREGDQVSAHIGASAAAGEFAGYWAVLEDGQVNRVTAGENTGSTLRHDHVVSFYQPVEGWDAKKDRQLSMRLPASNAGQRVAFVVIDSRLTTPVQALVLACR